MTENVQLILDDSSFNKDGLDGFLAETGVVNSGNRYQVIAIMGPQSSGKSTLMNHLFATRFQEMDALTGRRQTTRGVWLSKSPKLDDPVTLVMDLEGNDGRERGEDDTNFERQSALFALAVADVLMVNIWCHDIGREHGAGKPLMKTILQVNLKLFGKEQHRRKTVLLFVIRDKSKTPLQKLSEVLEADLNTIWDSISKPSEFRDATLQDLFEVQYCGLSHYEERHEDFLADVNFLRRRFDSEGDDSLVRPDQQRLPANSLALSTQQIWGVIQSQKDLNLPAHKVMVANIRCQEIKQDQLRRLTSDQAWEALVQEAARQLLPDFGARSAALLDSCITGYEAEAMYFDSGVRQAKRGELQEALLQLLRPLHEQQVAALGASCTEEFERGVRELVGGGMPFKAAAAKAAVTAVEKFRGMGAGLVAAGTGWGVEEEARELQRKLRDLAGSMAEAKITGAIAEQQKAVAGQLGPPVISLLEEMPVDLWPQLHELLDRTVSSATASALQQLQGYDVEGEDEQAARVGGALREAGQSRLEAHVREAALLKLSRMKDRFHDAFNVDPETATPRTWTARADIPAIARDARAVAANVLAQLAFIRPPAGGPALGDAEEAVEVAVQQLLDRAGVARSLSSRSVSTRSRDGPATSFLAAASTSAPAATASSAPAAAPTSAPGAFNIMSATEWPGVPEERVLLRPEDVRVAWREFLTASNTAIQQAENAKQAHVLANKRGLPIWALFAMVALGWNEVMALVWSPVWLILGLLGFLFLKSLYDELEVDAEMQRGALPGAVSIASKLRPAFRKVMGQTVESAQTFIKEKSIELQQRNSTAASSDEGSSGQSQRPSAGGLSQRRQAVAAEESSSSTPLD